jgi:hypothetical protein
MTGSKTSNTFSKIKSAPNERASSLFVISLSAGSNATIFSDKTVLPSLAKIDYFKSSGDIFSKSLAKQFNSLFTIIFPP